MSARSFFDTNVLGYSDDKASPAKQRRALDLIVEHRRSATGVVSLQILQEYFVAATKKLSVDSVIARRKIELLAEFDDVIPEVADILAAIDLHRLHGFSFWDPHPPLCNASGLFDSVLRRLAARSSLEWSSDCQSFSL